MSFFEKRSERLCGRLVFAYFHVLSASVRRCRSPVMKPPRVTINPPPMWLIIDSDDRILSMMDHVFQWWSTLEMTG
jgi:hypothetical protein